MIGPICATLMYRSGKVISVTLMYLKWTNSFIGVIRSRAGPGWVGPGFAVATGHNPASRPLLTTPGGEVVRLRGEGRRRLLEHWLPGEGQWRSVSALSAAFGGGCSLEVEAASSADSAAIPRKNMRAARARRSSGSASAS